MNMSQLPLDQSISRFQENEERLDQFVNDPDGYTSSTGQNVESIPAFLERVESEIDATGAIAITEANKTASANSAAAANASATNADASRIAAQAARDAAQLSGGVYVDTTTGLAATTEGRYFSVPSATSTEYLILYRKVSGAAMEVKRYPSTAAIDLYGSTVKSMFINGYMDANKGGVNRAGSGTIVDITDEYLNQLGLTKAIELANLSVLQDSYGVMPTSDRSRKFRTGDWVSFSVFVKTADWTGLEDTRIGVLILPDTAESTTQQHFRGVANGVQFESIRSDLRRYFGVVQITVTMPDLGAVWVEVTGKAGRSAAIYATGYACAVTRSRPAGVEWNDFDPYKWYNHDIRLASLEALSSLAASAVVKSQVVNGNLPGGVNQPNHPVVGQGTIVPITDTYLNSFGINYAKELTNLAAIQDSYGAIPKVRPYKSGDWVACSVFIKTADWAGLETSRLRMMIYTDGITNTNQHIFLTSYQEIRPDLRRYYAVGQISGTNKSFDFGLIEVTTKAGRSAPLYVTGYAAALSEGKMLAVDWADFDPYSTKTQNDRLTAAEGRLTTVESALAVGATQALGLMVPSSFHLVQGRPLSVLRSGLTESRDLTRYEIAFAGNNPAGTRPFMGFVEGQVELDGNRLSGAGAVWARKKNTDNSNIWKRPVTFYSSAPNKTASPKVMVIGDSLTYQGTVSAMNAKLAESGVTPTYIATYKEVGGLWAEGRPSWRFTNYTYKETYVNQNGSGTINPVTNQAAYLALGTGPSDYAPRWSYNPFLRLATGSDNPAFVFNNYIFDMRYYLDRFAFPDPDIVMIALGTNDYANHTQSTAYANCTEALNIMFTQIRAALPNAKIGIVLNSLPSVDTWNKTVPFFKHVFDVYGDREAEGVFVLPVFLTQDTKFIYGITVSSTDALTGVQTGTTADWVHSDALGRSQWAEMTYAFVMNQV